MSRISPDEERVWLDYAEEHKLYGGIRCSGNNENSIVYNLTEPQKFLLIVYLEVDFWSVELWSLTSKPSLCINQEVGGCSGVRQHRIRILEFHHSGEYPIV